MTQSQFKRVSQWHISQIQANFGYKNVTWIQMNLPEIKHVVLIGFSKSPQRSIKFIFCSMAEGVKTIFMYPQVKKEAYYPYVSAAYRKDDF